MNADKRHGLARGKGDKQNRDKYKRKIPDKKTFSSIRETSGFKIHTWDKGSSHPS